MLSIQPVIEDVLWKSKVQKLDLLPENGTTDQMLTLLFWWFSIVFPSFHFMSPFLCPFYWMIYLFSTWTSIRSCLISFLFLVDPHDVKWNTCETVPSVYSTGGDCRNEISVLMVENFMVLIHLLLEVLVYFIWKSAQYEIAPACILIW